MTLKQIGHFLTRPVLLHWLMPYLMALVAVGTVAQKYIGLYDSQKMFFSSFVFFVGPLPLPGGRAVTALLLISLLAKLILASPWRKATSGNFIAHLGVLMLLIGGLVTAVSSVEGYMLLSKNASASSFSDYHLRELTISKNNVPLLHLPLSDIRKGRIISGAVLPFTLTVHDSCRNCTMAIRQPTTADLKGSAQKVMLSPLDSYLDEERNFAGLEFSLSGAGPKNDGTYIAFEPMEKQPSFMISKDSYHISAGRAKYTLPFSLQLLEAEKQLHPGTDVPRSYCSVVMLSDGDVHQRAVITMNHPLRYKGYTVYQASFNGGDQTQSVSFAIVQNSGRVFPYVASITLCIGLIIHLCFRLPTLIRRRNDAI